MHKIRNLNHMALVETVAHEAGISPKVVERVLRVTFDVIGRTVVGGFKVTVTNFGSWYSAELSARMRRNPQTGETFEVEPRSYPRFRWSPAVKIAARDGVVLKTLKKRPSHH